MRKKILKRLAVVFALTEAASLGYLLIPPAAVDYRPRLITDEEIQKQEDDTCALLKKIRNDSNADCTAVLSRLFNRNDYKETAILVICNSRTAALQQDAGDRIGAAEKEMALWHCGQQFLKANGMDTFHLFGRVHMGVIKTGTENLAAHVREHGFSRLGDMGRTARAVIRFSLTGW